MYICIWVQNDSKVMSCLGITCPIPARTCFKSLLFVFMEQLLVVVFVRVESWLVGMRFLAKVQVS